VLAPILDSTKVPPVDPAESTSTVTPSFAHDLRYAEAEIMRRHLESPARLLHENGEDIRAAMIELAASASDSELDAILASNDLWGGSGSIADCAVSVESLPRPRQRILWTGAAGAGQSRLKWCWFSPALTEKLASAVDPLRRYRHNPH
jgi:hypothetical protein